MIQREVIKNVLSDFFSINEEVEEASFLGLTMDEEEVEILAEAINEALEKSRENQVKF